MHSKAQSTEFVFATLWHAAALVFTLLIVLALILVFCPASTGANVQSASHLHLRTGRVMPPSRRDNG